MGDVRDEIMADSSAPADPMIAEEDLDAEFPNRPRNHSQILPFHDLLTKVFDPLNAIKARPTGSAGERRKLGRHGPNVPSPHEAKRTAIERFISLWRQKVGNDIYPAFRLIIPSQDRDRPMYGLKESKIASMLVKIMGIPKDSPDAISLLKWKVPTRASASQMAGDFAGRCYEVIKKRPVLTEMGDMTIGEVNESLDRLAAGKEEAQRKVFQDFYARMNASELEWLIRIILRQMKVGATERTFFELWHPDAESLFKVCSSLRRVCWELHDPKFRLNEEDMGVTLMQCFQPQLAHYQMNTIEKMAEKMLTLSNNEAFWVEEKLDGERMQMHMVSDNTHEGGKTFQFWSRKGKDYTYLYGNGLYDNNASLTRYLKEAFDERVKNIILDGEMITWDPEQGAIVPFGTLKTAAIGQQRNPFSDSIWRPVFKVFDILYLNDKPLTQWTLRDRRKVLTASVRSQNDRFNIHGYTEGRTVADVESLLRDIITSASEGLVVKNPRSIYQVDKRSDDWVKVKPEYMTEYGESIDCVVIGGYYGSGHRGGRLSSFLCGLRANGEEGPMKFYSFFKVGGGLRSIDYKAIYQATHGKWKTWDPKKPPMDFIELAGGKLQYEKPDEWIRPDESVVLEVKGASVTQTDTFRAGCTLRFPRYKTLRDDLDWKSAMSLEKFMSMKSNLDGRKTDKDMKVDDSRKKRLRTTVKKPLKVAGGGDDFVRPYDGAPTDVFKGLSFYVLTESPKPNKMTKDELQQLVKVNGGAYFQTFDARPNTICIADRRVVKAASLQKLGTIDIVRPVWLIDCVKQAEADRGKAPHVLPLEPKYMFHTTPDSYASIEHGTDKHGDSYAKDVTPDELREILAKMPKVESSDTPSLFTLTEEHNHNFPAFKSHLFSSLTLLFLNLTTSTQTCVQPSSLLYARYAGANIITLDPSLASLEEGTGITHVIIGDKEGRQYDSTMEKDLEKEKEKIVREERGKVARRVREKISTWKRLPRVVSSEWVEACWQEGTRLDEEGFAVV